MLSVRDQERKKRLNKDKEAKTRPHQVKETAQQRKGEVFKEWRVEIHLVISRLPKGTV
jgi:hypothetical protein